MLRVSGKASLLQDGKYIVRLPTEAEWEKVTRGGSSRGYPWGDSEWDEERANILASEIYRPTPVGMYPKGSTPGGEAAVHDLGGNVWEWTLSLYRNYPYQPEKGLNDWNGAGSRVVRGGSWADHRGEARGASRYGSHPDGWDYHLSFRLVWSLADSEF